MKKYLCTRPKLAAELQFKGYPAEQTVNPWSPDRSAWLFDNTRELLLEVGNYYDREGLKLSQTAAQAINKARNGGSDND